MGRFALNSVLRESFSNDLFELGKKRIEVTYNKCFGKKNILEIQDSV